MNYLDKALDNFEKDLQLSKELCETDVTNAVFKNGLAISYFKIGETLKLMGDLNKALGYFKNGIKLFEEMYEINPNNLALKYNLALSYVELGSILYTLRSWNKALSYFKKFNFTIKELYEDYPNNVNYKTGLAISYAKLGVFFRDQLQQLDEAHASFQQAEKIWEELVQDAPQYVMFQQYLSMVRDDLSHL